jgi:hypothetical protein
MDPEHGAGTNLVNFYHLSRERVLFIGEMKWGK